MDNLSMDSTEAIKAGMSYGRWKAFNPETKSKRESMISGFKYVKTCSICGREFGTNSSLKKYCGYECAEKKKNEKCSEIKKRRKL